MFNNLYNGFFLPLIEIAIILTAIYIFYQGVIKRQIRQALISGLLQTILCLIFAAVIAGNPSFWIPLPNRIATFGESMVVSALGQSTAGQNGLCGTNVGALEIDKTSLTGTIDENSITSQLDKIGKNMKSTIGCRMWEEFLFNPWVRGQFGTEYDELNAKGTSGTTINNINNEWVKSADVPLGGDIVEHNWALFQLSIQTEAHAQLSDETGEATDSTTNQVKKVDGVSTDWWRIVDAFSNYDEKQVTKSVDGGSDVEVTEQVESTPLSQWETWNGSRQVDRYSTSLLSVLFGGIGSIGPLFFGLLTAIYSIGVSLLMAVSPIFFLMGCWAGYGESIFRGWLESLVSTMIKKILSAALLLVSFSFSVSAMNMIDSVGWIKSFILLLILTLILIKNRKFIFDTLSRVNFGGLFSPDKMFSQFKEKHKSKVSSVNRMAASSLVGAVEAKRAGLSIRDGLKMGAEEQFRQSLRRSTFGRNAEMAETRLKGLSAQSKCMICGTSIVDYGFIDEDGNSYCPMCAADMGLETELYKVKVNTKVSGLRTSNQKRLKEINKQRLITRGLKKKDLPNTKNANMKDLMTTNNQWLSYSKVNEIMAPRVDENNNVSWDDDNVKDMMISNLTRLESAFDEYDKKWSQYGERAVAPSTPEPIENYINAPILDEAWHSGRYDIVRNTYKEAWGNWYEDNSDSLSNVSEEDVEVVREMLKDFDSQKVHEEIKKTEAYQKKEDRRKQNQAIANENKKNKDSKLNYKKEIENIAKSKNPKDSLTKPDKNSKSPKENKNEDL